MKKADGRRPQPVGGPGGRTRRPRRRPAPPEMEEIRNFLRGFAPHAPEELARYGAEIVLTAIRLLDGQTPLADVKLMNAALRELRYAFRVFAPYRRTRKVTVFGSGRTLEGKPAYRQAERFAHRIADEGFMVITGAGGGIMRAAQSGAGRERSFGLNIRLPFEQVPNEFIRGDMKLLTFRYFFTRKLLFMKEADAVVLFPGGFGTNDEAYECLTLIQTGKAPLVPVVFLDTPGGDFWNERRRYFENRLLPEGMISPEDLHLFRVTDDVEEAVSEIKRFYRLYHSSRYVRDRLVLRLVEKPPPDAIDRVGRDFTDLLADGGFEMRDALPEEAEPELAALPRLVFRFNRVSIGRLRQMIDFLNGSVP